jgi:hypothetical protein
MIGLLAARVVHFDGPGFYQVRGGLDDTVSVRSAIKVFGVEGFSFRSLNNKENAVPGTGLRVTCQL